MLGDADYVNAAVAYRAVLFCGCRDCAIPGAVVRGDGGRVIRGATFYRTVLVLPYAIAPAVAGVLWLFMFSPSIGIVATGLKSSASTGTRSSTAATP